MGDFSEATTSVDDQVASEPSAIEQGDALGLSPPVDSDARVDEKPSEPPVDEVDDDWGGFGAFTGDEADDATKQSAQKSVANVDDIEPPPADVDADDGFGHFGSFDAFEEAPNQTPEVKERSNGELSREDSRSLPLQSSRVEVLNGAVRSVFQDVFPSSASLVDDNPAVCTELPFDVQMRVIMVSTPHTFVLN